MAKTKHQKLANKMSTMLKNIEQHLAKVSEAMEVIQMHFCGHGDKIFSKKYLTAVTLKTAGSNA